jgi:hypothetical protein
MQEFVVYQTLHCKTPLLRTQQVADRLTRLFAPLAGLPWALHD